MSVEFVESQQLATDLFSCRVTGVDIGFIIKSPAGFRFHPAFTTCFDGSHMRAIADKLDELNGVKK